MNLWVDDRRLPPVDRKNWICVLSSKGAITWLDWAKRMNRRVEVVSLDHDLGGEDTTRPVVLWMCENDFWPDDVVVHSSNPPGREWLEGMIARYKP